MIFKPPRKILSLFFSSGIFVSHGAMPFGGAVAQKRGWTRTGPASFVSSNHLEPLSVRIGQEDRVVVGYEVHSVVLGDDLVFVRAQFRPCVENMVDDG